MRWRRLAAAAFLIAGLSVGWAGLARATTPDPDASCAPLDAPEPFSWTLADVESLVAGLAALPPETCGEELIRAAEARRSLAAIVVASETLGEWRHTAFLPELYRIYGDAMLAPFERSDDLAFGIAHAIEATREADDVPVARIEWPSVRKAWLLLAEERFIAQWGQGAEPPSETDPAGFRALAADRFTRCLEDPEQAPADPFDPLGISSNSNSELAAATRCASAAVLAAWLEQGDDAWVAWVQSNIDLYPNIWTWGYVALEMERDRAPIAQEEPAAPDLALRSRWRPVDSGRSLVWWIVAAMLIVLVAVLVGLRDKIAWKALSMRLAAIGTGLLLIAAVEVVLTLAGLPAGDMRAPPWDPEPALAGSGEDRTLVLDQRLRPFVVPRPPGISRVAVVGASTIAGPGLHYWETIPGHLQTLLDEAGASVEVVSLGYHGIAAWKVRAAAITAVEDYDAQLVVVYTGHNEVADLRMAMEVVGLGPPPAVAPAVRVLRQTRLYGLLSSLRSPPEERRLGEQERHPVAEAVASRSRQLAFHDRRFERSVSARFEAEIDLLVRSVRTRGAEVVLVVPSFNHHGLRAPPHVSHRDPETEAEIAQLVPTVDADLREGRFEEALRKAEGLVAAAPESPTAFLLQGFAAEATGALDLAETSVWECARRNHGGSAATPGIVAGLLRVARRRGVPVADAHAALHEASPGRLPGFDLYWDYVHFQAEGSRVVAGEIARTLEEAALLSP